MRLGTGWVGGRKRMVESLRARLTTYLQRWCHITILRHVPDYISYLQTWVFFSIPVPPWSACSDLTLRPQMKEMNDWLECRLHGYGVDTKQVDLSKIVSTPDPPKLVLSKIDGAPGNNLKTVLVYGHYDVQPVSRFSHQSYYMLA